MKCSATAKTTGQPCRKDAVRDGRCGNHQVTLSDVAQSDNRLASLRKLREVLADAIDDKPAPRDLASLSRRYMQVIEEIEDLSDDDVEVEDEIARRRREKLAAASGS